MRKVTRAQFVAAATQYSGVLAQELSGTPQPDGPLRHGTRFASAVPSHPPLLRSMACTWSIDGGLGGETAPPHQTQQSYALRGVFRGGLLSCTRSSRPTRDDRYAATFTKWRQTWGAARSASFLSSAKSFVSGVRPQVNGKRPENAGRAQFRAVSYGTFAACASLGARRAQPRPLPATTVDHGDGDRL